MSRADAESDTAPAWFQQAIGHAPEHRDVEVKSTRRSRTPTAART